MLTFATQYRGVEQLVARRAHNPEVVGSSPSPATTKKRWHFNNSNAFLFVFQTYRQIDVCLMHTDEKAIYDIGF